jgi:hypothetical protein
VIASVPTGSVEVASAAALVKPPAAVRFAVPIAVEPSINTTDPVGAVDTPTTVPVSVTDCPEPAGFTDEVTVAVVDPAALTTWLSAFEVTGPKSVVAA